MAPDGDMDKIASNVSALGNGDLTPNASEPNEMKTQNSAGIGSGSASSGSWSFQFFVHNEDGLNLSLDLNSDPLDWMRACSNGITVPQHIHRSKALPIEEASTRRPMVADSNNSEGTLVDGFYKRSLSEQVGISRIDESSTGCTGKEVLSDLQMVPDGSKATGDLSEQCVVYEGNYLNQGVLNDSGQKPGDEQRFQAHEAYASVKQNAVPGVVRQPGDVEMMDQGISSGYGQESRDQQCVWAHEAVPQIFKENLLSNIIIYTCRDAVEYFQWKWGYIFQSSKLTPNVLNMSLTYFTLIQAMQNKNGEVSRNLQGGAPLENNLEEMNNTQPAKDFQNSERHKIEVKNARKTNLRTLKTLARGPIVLSDDDTKERRGRRKSARLTVKDL